MTGITVLIDFAGFVALLLWGVRMVQTGVARAFGAQLRLYLAQALGNRARAFFSGLGITALLQSSTATGLMITSFAAGGFVELVPALAVMLGANVGTTLIVQVLSFDLTLAAPALILMGVVMFRRGRASRTHDLGRVAIGLGLILLSLSQLLNLFNGLEKSQVMGQVLAIAALSPLADLLLATLLAWAAHSSVAVVLVIMSLVAQGSLGLEAAFAMVLGANLGSAINPVLEVGDDPTGHARRLALGNLFNRLLGAAVVLPLLEIAITAIRYLETPPSRLVADFHTFFNIGMALLFLPFLGVYARLLTRLLPERSGGNPGQPLYLDKDAQSTPLLALTAAAREALRMADALESMLGAAVEAMERNDRMRMEHTRTQDVVLNQLDHAIKSYLVAMDQEHLSREDQTRMQEILLFVSNLEYAGDVLDAGLMKPLARQTKQGIELSPAGQKELLEMMRRLMDNVRLAASVFISRDLTSARRLVTEKQYFRELEMKATEAHFERLKAGRIDSHQTSQLHMQMVHELKRINGCLVEGAAYPLLEAGSGGALKDTTAVDAGV